MENKELEEMRAQLAILNEKLENESIVDERLVSEATKKHISELQRKLIGRIVIITLWAAFFYWKLELGIFLLWCVGLLLISIYTYLVVRQGNSVSMPVTENREQVSMDINHYPYIGLGNIRTCLKLAIKFRTSIYRFLCVFYDCLNLVGGLFY